MRNIDPFRYRKPVERESHNTAYVTQKSSKIPLPFYDDLVKNYYDSYVNRRKRHGGGITKRVSYNLPSTPGFTPETSMTNVNHTPLDVDKMNTWNQAQQLISLGMSAQEALDRVATQRKIWEVQSKPTFGSNLVDTDKWKRQQVTGSSRSAIDYTPEQLKYLEQKRGKETLGALNMAIQAPLWALDPVGMALFEGANAAPAFFDTQGRDASTQLYEDYDVNPLVAGLFVGGAGGGIRGLNRAVGKGVKSASRLAGENMGALRFNTDPVNKASGARMPYTWEKFTANGPVYESSFNPMDYGYSRPPGLDYSPQYQIQLGEKLLQREYFDQLRQNAMNATPESLWQAFETRRANFPAKLKPREYSEAKPYTDNNDLKEQLVGFLRKKYPNATENELKTTIFEKEFGESYDNFVFTEDGITFRDDADMSLWDAWYNTSKGDELQQMSTKAHESNHSSFYTHPGNYDKKTMTVKGSRVYFTENAGCKPQDLNNSTERYLDVNEVTTYLSEAANILGKTAPWTAEELKWLSTHQRYITNKLGGGYTETFRRIFERITDYDKFAKAINTGGENGGRMYYSLSTERPQNGSEMFNYYVDNGKWNQQKIAKDINVGVNDVRAFFDSPLRKTVEDRNVRYAKMLGIGEINNNDTPIRADQVYAPININLDFHRPTGNAHGSITRNSDFTQDILRLSIPSSAQLDNTVFHEMLHRGDFGEPARGRGSEIPNVGLKEYVQKRRNTIKLYKRFTDKILKTEKELNEKDPEFEKQKELLRYLRNEREQDMLHESSTEVATNLLQIGRDMGIKPFSKYPGEAKLNELLDNYEKSNASKSTGKRSPNPFWIISL